jgi:hypothetical protein
MKTYSAILKNLFAAIIALPLYTYAEDKPSGFHFTDSVFSALATPAVQSATTNNCFETLGGNLPWLIAARAKPYLVTSDIYVPSGKTVTIERGAILLFKNFTGLHVEGRLIAEGDAGHPIVFSSEFDRTYNPAAPLHANPYDWNGIYIHESGLGSTMAHCRVLYSVYGVNSLTRYIRFASAVFADNGRSNLTIEGKLQPVTAAEPFTYALTLDDARKDGVPVAVLMDPRAKKRSILRYGGLSLLAGGITLTVWCSVLVGHDQQRMAALKDSHVTDENSNLVKNLRADWEKAERDKNRDVGFTMGSLVLAFIGGSGFGFSFTF